MQSVAEPQLHWRRDLDTASLPSTVHAKLLTFRPCFTQPSFENFTTLVVGWIMCIGRHSISRVVQAGRGATRKKHHSALYRFLSRARWVADSVGHALLDLLLPWLPHVILALVDDTLSRCNGPHIFGAGMHHDAVRSSYGRGAAAGAHVSFAFGHSWVVLALWVPLPWNADRGIAVPILFRLYRPKKRCPEGKYRKRTELAAELLAILASWLPADRPLEVVGDAEYASRTVVRGLKPGVIFTGPMSMDAALFAIPGPYRGMGRKRLKGARVPSPKALAEDQSVPWRKVKAYIYGKRVSILVKQQRCLWYTVAKNRPLRMIVTRDPSGKMPGDRAFFCTDARRPAHEILRTFARRWELEVTFRNVKQSMGLEEPQNGWWRRRAGTPAPPRKRGPNPHARRGEIAVRHTVPLAFIAYATVVAWYFTNGRCEQDVGKARRAAPWYRHKLTPSFIDMLAAMRREIWTSRLSARPEMKHTPSKVRDLLPSWLLAA